MDQYETADALGIAQSTYCDWETDKMKPQKRRLALIAVVLGFNEARLRSWWMAS